MKESKQKILFICGSLDPGKDGVGDYTYQLSKELSKQGYTVAIIAIYDKFIETPLQEIATKDGIDVMRISSRFSKEKKSFLIKDFVKKHNPTYISLQFVPFSFHKRGTPWLLVNILSKIKSVRWHIMFHELWVGMEKNDPWKLKLWGHAQYQIIKQLIKKLKPQVIHSSNPLYLQYLRQIAKTNIVKELPLFGNIKKKFSKQNLRASKNVKFIIFAGIHHGAPVNVFLSWIKQHIINKGFGTEVIFIGKNGSHLSEWTDELTNHRIKYHILGIQDNDIISKTLASADIGISTTPYYLSEKSGSVATMLEHQLPVICISREWMPNIDIDLTSLRPKNIIQWHNKLKLEGILKHKPQYNSLEAISKQFIQDLEWHL